MDQVGDGPFEYGGGRFNSCPKDVPHCHEEMVVTEPHRLGAELCGGVVVLGAALGSQQGVQKVPLNMVTVV